MFIRSRVRCARGAADAVFNDSVRLGGPWLVRPYVQVLNVSGILTFCVAKPLLLFGSRAPILTCAGSCVWVIGGPSDSVDRVAAGGRVGRCRVGEGVS